jgi:hypothetical protein
MVLVKMIYCLLQPPGPGVRESSQLGTAGTTEVEVILKVRIN